MRWDGWGTPDRASTLAEPVRGLLEQMLGIRPPATAPVSRDAVCLAPPALGDAVLARLGTVDSSDDGRLAHTRGKSTVDLLRMRRGDTVDAPDAVVRPGSHDEVLEVLSVCTAEGIAVVPFGGGTSVVGGLAPRRDGFAGVVALDLGRLDQLTTVDTESRLAVLQAGVTGPAAEELLGRHGFTLGHFPQSYEHATIGGYAATRSSGQYSLGYGRFDELVLGLRVATPRGTVEVGRAPRSAAGPDLRQLFLGSEGTLGVITEVTAQIRPVPVDGSREAWRFSDVDAGLATLRRIVQDGPRPTMARLSDETETLVNAMVAGAGADGAAGCLAMVSYEDAQAVRDRAAVQALLTASGAQRLDDAVAADWPRTRFAAPYLRDALLDAGALVETLETAAFWSAVPGLRMAVRDAVTQALAEQGTPPVVLCHVSHLYPAGAALYFTVVCAQTDDPIAQWTRAKAAATRAILDSGGTVTHHHAVGRDHAAGLAEEIGALGLDTLRAAKTALDPAAILNPGILLP
jgi:alkyldihydroxyacetonephosphate synthase